MFSFILPIVGVIVLLILIGSMVRWQVASPNEALIISGSHGVSYVTGKGTLVWPMWQNIRRLSLNMREAPLSTDCPTFQGVQTGVRGSAVYKIASDKDSLANAAQRFLDQPKEMMDKNIVMIFDGHLRAIIGKLTMEALLRDRDALVHATLAASADDMAKFGLVVDTLVIQEIKDPSGYIENLALPHISEVKQLARVATANNNQIAVEAEQLAAANIAAAQRDSEIKQAGYTAEVATATAIAAQQGPLADAKAQQAVITQQTEIQRLEAIRVEQQLDVEVRKPAAANAFAVKTAAEGARDAAIATAQGQAQQTTLAATAKAEAIKITGEADAAATMATGTADAAVVKLKLVAEADGLKARSDALAANPEAVINQQLTELMPVIVEKAASAFSNIKSLTMLDGTDGMNKSVAGIISAGAAMAPMIANAFSVIRAAAAKPAALTPAAGE